jgi:hypothetical protein
MHCRAKVAVVDDLDSMKTANPLLGKDEFFLPCLVRLFESSGVTLFLFDRQPRGSFDEHDRRLVSLSQNVLRLFHVTEPGRDRVAIVVTKSARGVHNNAPMELKGHARALEILDSFRMLKNISPDGTASHIGIRFLFAVDTKSQARYYQEIARVHDFVKTNVRIRAFPPGHDWHRRLLSPDFLFAAGDVVIVEVDNSDFPDLVERGYFEDLTGILDKGDVERAFGETVQAKELFGERGPFLPSMRTHLPPRPPGARASGPKGKAYYPRYQLPYRSDPVVLGCDRQSRDELLGSIGDSYTWDDLLAYARRKTRRMRHPLKFFDCVAPGPLTHCCLFLEIFYSLLDKLPAMRRGCLRLCDDLSNHDEELRHALRLMHLLAGPSAGNRTYLRHSDGDGRGVSSVFARYWYGMFREAAARACTGHSTSDMVAMPLPGKKSILSDYHLCLLQGSAAPRVGASMILDLCTEELVSERLARGIGMPLTKRFYESDMQLPISGLSTKQCVEIHKNAISRSQIRCLKAKSALLASCISDFLRRPACEAQKAQIVEDAVGFIRTLFPAEGGRTCAMRRGRWEQTHDSDLPPRCDESVQRLP